MVSLQLSFRDSSVKHIGPGVCYSVADQSALPPERGRTLKSDKKKKRGNEKRKKNASDIRIF